MADSSLLPHVTPEKYSPLEALMRSAMRRFGDFGAARVEGELSLLLLDLANQVLEDLMMHPYWTGGTIPYYTHQSEVREVPDLIMLYGLVAHYAFQQASDKTQPSMQLYNRTMNQMLYRLNGGATNTTGNPRVELHPPEQSDGSYRRTSDGRRDRDV